MRLTFNSSNEVSLLSYYYLQQQCVTHQARKEADTGHSGSTRSRSKKTAAKPSPNTPVRWSSLMNDLTHRAPTIVRELISPDALLKLTVESSTRLDASNTAPNTLSPVLHPPSQSTRSSSDTRGKHASYKMVQAVFTKAVQAVAEQLKECRVWEEFTGWLEDEIAMIRWGLYQEDHRYVLDFSAYPSMTDWLEWSFSSEDTDTSEGTEPFIDPVTLEQLENQKNTMDNTDEGMSDSDLAEYTALFGNRDDSESDESEESEESDDLDDELNDDEKTNTPSDGQQNFLSLLLRLRPSDTGENSAASRNARNAKTPEGKAFWDMLKARAKGNSTDASFFNTLDKTAQQALLTALRAVNAEKSTAPLLFRILQSHLPASVKNEMMSRFENARGEESAKYITWVNAVLQLPFDQYVTPNHVKVASQGSATKVHSFFQSCRETLDAAVYGHEDAKDQLVQYIAQMTRQSVKSDKSDNSDTNTNKTCAAQKGLVLGIQGPFGNGKTTLIEKGVSKVLGLPFYAIPLGGASDGSFLNGHSYTYEGSLWGQIADVLMKAKCSNPIIYLDELDKVSASYKGQEVIHQLVHLTDPSQNTHFQDRYMGNIDIDLSQVTWVFSYNDRSNIPAVLRDRITEVRTQGFTLPQKQTIVQRFLVPSICKEIGMPEVSFQPEVVKHMIEQFTYEGGVRSIKKLLFEVCRNLNKDDLCGTVQLSVPVKRRRITRQQTATATQTSSFRHTPYTVTMDDVRRYLKHKTPMVKERIHKAPAVGRINGLYASSGVDMGGVIPIETKFVPSNDVYGLSLTGNLGKVMQESGTVAKTLALQCTNARTRQQWESRWSTLKESIHLHCPEGAVSKDGPSAGTALTVAILSLLTGNKIAHTIGITGEINLFGEVMAIGGLRSKMYGAKSAGCRLVLYPKDNQNDYDKIVRECPDLVDDTFRGIAVSTLADVLPYAMIGKKGLSKELVAGMKASGANRVERIGERGGEGDAMIKKEGGGRVTRKRARQ